MTAPPSSLWRHADFLKFWIGQTISGFGSRFTGLALPFVAITTLGATPAQFGLLAAAGGLPWLLFGPFIGVGIDRLRRRPILIIADLGRAVLLASIPIAALLGHLTMAQLYVVEFLTGLLTAWFDTAYQSYLPSLVERTQLIDGNGKLNVSNSAADVAGPGLAGIIIQAIGAPLAVAVDALSFLASILSLWLIRTPELPPSRSGKQAIWSALAEGTSYIWHQRILRAFAATNATFMCCIGIAESVSLFFLTSRLHLTAGLIGVILGAGSVGGLLGALLAGWVSRRFPVGRTIIGASFLRGFGLACVPLAAVLPGAIVPFMVIVAYAIHQCGWSVWSVTQASVRQALVPHQLQGRVTASFLFIVRGATPVGALLGGVLGEWLGITPTFVIAGVGLLASSVWLVLSPLRSLQEQPVPGDVHAAGVVSAE